MKRLSFTCMALLMTACGGGGGANNAGAPPPPPSARITSVTPAFAIIGTRTSFEISGTNLPDGMRFSLGACIDPAEVAGGTSVKRHFTCTPVSTVVSSKGQVSSGTTAEVVPFDFVVDYRSPVLAADVSANSMMVVTADGTLWSWGGHNGTSEGSSLLPVKLGNDFVWVTSGMGVSLAVKKDGSLWSWGGGEVLGTDTVFSSKVPLQIGSGFRKVSVEWRNTTSGEHAIGLKTDGSLWVWGMRAHPTEQYGSQRTPRMFATGFSDLGANDTALKSDGSVWSWHVTSDVLVPTDPTDPSYHPVQAGTGYTALGGGFNVNFGLRADGTLWNWGSYAIVPAGSTRDSETHYLVEGGVRTIATAPYRAMVIKSDDSLWYIGGSAPIMEGKFISAWTSDSCSMALQTDGSLWLWGLCYYGDGGYARYNRARFERLTLPQA